MTDTFRDRRDPNLYYLAAEQAITLFPAPDHQPARADHTLWIDETGRYQYSSLARADQELGALRDRHLASAQESLRKGDLDAAEADAGLAMAADPRALAPRALVAACIAARGSAEELRVMQEISVAERDPKGEFAAKTAQFLSFSRQVLGPLVRTPRPAKLARFWASSLENESVFPRDSFTFSCLSTPARRSMSPKSKPCKYRRDLLLPHSSGNSNSTGRMKNEIAKGRTPKPVLFPRWR